MAKTSNINIRIEPETKAKAEELFSNFGISVTDAINIFLNTSIMNGGFPFEIVVPRYNRETELAIEESKDIMSGKINAKTYSSAKELFENLDAED